MNETIYNTHTLPHTHPTPARSALRRIAASRFCDHHSVLVRLLVVFVCITSRHVETAGTKKTKREQKNRRGNYQCIAAAAVSGYVVVHHQVVSATRTISSSSSCATPRNTRKATQNEKPGSTKSRKHFFFCHEVCRSSVQVREGGPKKEKGSKRERTDSLF